MSQPVPCVQQGWMTHMTLSHTSLLLSLQEQPLDIYDVAYITSPYLTSMRTRHHVPTKTILHSFR